MDVVDEEESEESEEEGNAVWFEKLRWTRLKIEEVREALVAGKEPDAKDGQGRTALFSAASWNRIDIVELLLEFGADPLNGLPEAKGRVLKLLQEKHREQLPGQAAVATDTVERAEAAEHDAEAEAVEGRQIQAVQDTVKYLCINQTAAATQMGVSASELSQWLRRKAPPAMAGMVSAAASKWLAERQQLLQQKVQQLTQQLSDAQTALATEQAAREAMKAATVAAVAEVRAQAKAEAAATARAEVQQQQQQQQQQQRLTAAEAATMITTVGPLRDLAFDWEHAGDRFMGKPAYETKLLWEHEHEEKTPTVLKPLASQLRRLWEVRWLSWLELISVLGDLPRA